MRLLLLEYDLSVGSAAKDGLAQHGLVCDGLQLAAEFNSAMLSRRHGCVPLDLILPDGIGGQWLDAVCRRGDVAPVIVVTAQSQGEPSVDLLDSGADNDGVKPDDKQNLSARARAVMRRSRASDNANALSHGHLALHAEGRVATWHGDLLRPTKKGYGLLAALMRQRSRALKRSPLEDALYGCGEDKGAAAEEESNSLRVCIHHLRRKFCAELILTVRNLGNQMGSEALLAAKA